jgi:preprotein translocase subunit SecD
MNFYPMRFNLYFSFLLVATVALLGAGCATKEEKEAKLPAGLRIHVESRGNVPGSAKVISVLRTSPLELSVAQEPILTEANILAATLLETPGGFAIQVRFDETGSLTLEQFSASNPGRHFAIFGQWGEKMQETRWLAVPLITGRISNGTLSFTPDTSRDEAFRLVRGLNNTAKKYAKDKMIK